MSKRLKVGVIGVGGIAKTHLPGWKDSPHTELVAMADMNGQVLRRVAAEHDVGRLYEDAAQLIADPEVDVVDICTPNMFHVPLAVAALQAGKHVYCEKPLGPTPDGIRQIIAARDTAGKLVMTAHQMRFEGAATAIKAEIDAGVLGDIYHARVWFLRRTQLPCWSKGFVRKDQSGGGPTIDVGVHVLDLALWLMNFPEPVAVSGVARRQVSAEPGAFSDWGGTVPDDMDVEDYAIAYVRFANDATLILETSWLMHHPDNQNKMWLYGNKAGATWPDAMLYTSDNAKRQRYDVKLTNIPKVDNPRAEACKAFAEAIAHGRPSPLPPEQSLTVQRVLEATYRSTQTKREVRLDDASV